MALIKPGRGLARNDGFNDVRATKAIFSCDNFCSLEIVTIVTFYCSEEFVSVLTMKLFSVCVSTHGLLILVIAAIALLQVDGQLRPILH